VTLIEKYEMALVMADDGFCTKYPGYTCDKEFPTECPECILQWIIGERISDMYDKRLGKYAIKKR
jgi:hypothetical protein